MSSAPENSRQHIDEAAAEWVLRADRGLTPAEQDAFSQWLAADPRHGDAFAEQRWSWEELDRIAGLEASFNVPDPDLLRPSAPAPVRQSRPLQHWLALGGLAAALAIGGYWIWPAAAPEPVVATVLAAPLERRTLEDGSIVDCNRGAEIELRFTPEARHVRLVRGEANFTVAKDPHRPFFVTAGDVTVRAVGTVFNVRVDPHVVEVVVQEGLVRLETPGPARASEPAVPLLEASQRAIVAHTPAARPLVGTLSPRELEARLAWLPRLLDFNEASLEDIVAAFNRHNVVRVTIKDPRLMEVRLSATFRSDNLQGFLRLVESEFGIRAAWRSERDVTLQRAE
jgi:transmembrane sensor